MIRGSASLRQELAYCVPLGIPLSMLQGEWSGQWTQKDREIVFTWQAIEQERCSGCGTVTSDWLDEEGRDVMPPPYVLETIRCIGCATIEAEKSRMDREKAGDGIKLFFRRFIRGPVKQSAADQGSPRS